MLASPAFPLVKEGALAQLLAHLAPRRPLQDLVDAANAWCKGDHDRLARAQAILSAHLLAPPPPAPAAAAAAVTAPAVTTTTPSQSAAPGTPGAPPAAAAVNLAGAASEPASATAAAAAAVSGPVTVTVQLTNGQLATINVPSVEQLASATAALQSAGMLPSTFQLPPQFAPAAAALQQQQLLLGAGGASLLAPAAPVGQPAGPFVGFAPAVAAAGVAPGAWGAPAVAAPAALWPHGAAAAAAALPEGALVLPSSLAAGQVVTASAAGGLQLLQPAASGGLDAFGSGVGLGGGGRAAMVSRRPLSRALCPFPACMSLPHERRREGPEPELCVFSAQVGGGRGGSGSSAVPRGVCSIDGCAADLSQLREYHQRFRICDYHLKVSHSTVCVLLAALARSLRRRLLVPQVFTRRVCSTAVQVPSIMRDGVLQRFCQQCGRFHHLSEFDGAKRSCRTRLDRHNARRRKRGNEGEGGNTNTTTNSPAGAGGRGGSGGGPGGGNAGTHHAGNANDNGAGAGGGNTNGGGGGGGSGSSSPRSPSGSPPRFAGAPSSSLALHDGGGGPQLHQGKRLEPPPPALASGYGAGRVTAVLASPHGPGGPLKPPLLLGGGGPEGEQLLSKAGTGTNSQVLLRGHGSSGSGGSEPSTGHEPAAGAATGGAPVGAHGAANGAGTLDLLLLGREVAGSGDGKAPEPDMATLSAAHEPRESGTGSGGGGHARGWEARAAVGVGSAAAGGGDGGGAAKRPRVEGAAAAAGGGFPSSALSMLARAAAERAEMDGGGALCFT